MLQSFRLFLQRTKPHLRRCTEHAEPVLRLQPFSLLHRSLSARALHQPLRHLRRERLQWLRMLQCRRDLRRLLRLFGLQFLLGLQRLRKLQCLRQLQWLRFLQSLRGVRFR